MLRITPKRSPSGTTELVLAGRISAEEIALLEREIGIALRQPPQLVINLDGVQFIDQAGLDLLEYWRGEGLQLCGGSTFIQRVLSASRLKGGD